MKIVGNRYNCEFEPDPNRAWKRAKVLDAMLATALVPHPKGIWRLTHSQMNAMDFKRQLLQAATVNKQ